MVSLTYLRMCTCVCGYLLGCRQERREVSCSSFVVCDFKRKFLIWYKISSIDCISQAAEVRHDQQWAVGVARVKLVPALLHGAVFPLLSVELRTLSLLNSRILGALPWEGIGTAHVSQSNSLIIFIESFMLFCIAYKIYTRL